jgi:hypothetical protein
VCAVLRAVFAFRLARPEGSEVGEDLVRSLEPLAAVRHEERDLVLALAVLLPRRDLFRDEVDAELRQPLADGGGVRAPLGLVQRQHKAMLVGTSAA